MEDKDIIQLLQTSCSEGVYQLVLKYRAGVTSIIGRILRGRAEDIEECVQDTFVRIWKAVKSGAVLQQTETFKGLVLSTARNVAITRYNTLKKQNVILLENEEDIQDDNDLLDCLIEKEESEKMQNAILEMEEPDKEIFFRRYFLFESTQEIAVATGCTAVQVKNRLYRGKAELKKNLQKRGIGNEA